MKESKTLRDEAKRIHWRLAILQGKHGAQALRRITAIATLGIPERFCT